MEIEIVAYTSDRGVHTSNHRGEVLHVAAMSILVLLGSSLWLPSVAPSAEKIIALLCAVTSSGESSVILESRVAVALFTWILGNMLFSQLLFEDMNSSISLP